MTPDHSALIERLDLIVAEIDGLPHVKQTVAESAAALRDLTEWREIATAPKDGARVLLFSVPNEVPSLRPHIADGYWKASTGLMAPGFWMLGQSVGPSFCPTHWLPLPSAPNQAKEAGE